jgi:hypothetical protein
MKKRGILSNDRPIQRWYTFFKHIMFSSPPHSNLFFYLFIKIILLPALSFSFSSSAPFASFIPISAPNACIETNVALFQTLQRHTKSRIPLFLFLPLLTQPENSVRQLKIELYVDNFTVNIHHSRPVEENVAVERECVESKGKENVFKKESARER